MEKGLVVFEDERIRRIWHNDDWFYSVVDMVGILSGSPTPRQYWGKVKAREFNEVQVSPIWVQLKMISDDGKMYMTDCANKKGLFRIIQSIPSKRAEPFKLWLARVGSERVNEIDNPELAQERMKTIYEAKGYSKGWIDKRIRGIAVRQDLTDEWKARGVERKSDFAILTAEISKATFDMYPTEYKKFKGLERENLRDHMTDLELIFSMLGEASTAELERVRDPVGMDEHLDVAVEGGSVAGVARKDLERKSGKKISSSENYLRLVEKDKRDDTGVLT